MICLPGCFFFIFLMCERISLIVIDELSNISNLYFLNSLIARCHSFFLLSVNSYGFRAINKFMFPMVAIIRLNSSAFGISNENVIGTIPFFIAANLKVSIVAVFPKEGLAANI